MKKLFLFASTALLASTLFLASCSKTDDPATSPSTAAPRDRFHGNWYIQENSSVNGTSSYYVTIADSTNASYISFGYLYGFTKKTYATFNGNNFTFPSQQPNPGYIVTGSGRLSNSNRIDMTYIVWSGSSNYDTLKCVLTK